VHDFECNHYLTHAAALSFFFLLSIFPLLIFLSTALAYVPIPHLFDQILDFLAMFMPQDAMGVVRRVLHDVLRTNPELLSAGVAAAVFAASSGFTAMIDVLNIAYDVREGRPYWEKRLVAIALTLLTGVGAVFALAAIALGPQFGMWLANHLHAGWAFGAAWPYIRWLAIAVFTVLSVELIYFVAPNVKQRFVVQIPGAILAVLSWIAASWGLSWYLRSFAHYNKTFGALGAVVALMLWLYVSALAIILGAELNSEILKSSGRVLPAKEKHGQLLNMDGDKQVRPQRRAG
jgi:membrane protein